jgi:signal transduction histidine kinase
MLGMKNKAKSDPEGEMPEPAVATAFLSNHGTTDRESDGRVWLLRWHMRSRLAEGAGYFERNLRTMQAFWDDGYCELMGIAPGSPPLDRSEMKARVHADERSAWDEVVREVQAAAVGHTGINLWRVARPDGGWRHVQVNWAIELDARGDRVLFGCALDVSTSIEQAETISRSARQMAMAMDAARIGFAQIDVERNLWHGNRVGREVMGLPGEGDLALDEVVRRTHSEDRESVLTARVQALASPGVAVATRHRFQAADGRWLHIRVHRAALPAGEGKEPEIFAIFIDETEAWAASQRERALRAEHEQALAIAELGYWRSAGPGELLHGDARMARMLGMAAQPCQMGWNEWLNRVHPEERGRVSWLTEYAWSGRVGNSLRLRLLRADGGVIWAQMACQRIEAAGVATLVATLQDITEREWLLRRQQAVFHSSPTAMLISSDEGPVTDANTAAERLFGRPRWELMQAATPLPLAASAEAMPGPRRAVAIERPDGSVAYAELSLVRDFIDGHTLWLCQDVSERHRAEQRLRERDLARAHDYDQMRTELARDVHDQLGQALSTLVLETEQLVRRDAVEGKRLHRLVQEAVRGVREISQTLRPPDLNEGLHVALQQLVREVSAGSDVDVQLLLGQTPPMLKEEPLRCAYRVVQEALNNAIKHSGAAQVRVSVVPASASAASLRWRVEVADKGLGFDSNAADSFAGLGLRSMQERAREIGAELAIHSQPGSGTRVCLELTEEHCLEDRDAHRTL